MQIKSGLFILINFLLPNDLSIAKYFLEKTAPSDMCAIDLCRLKYEQVKKMIPFIKLVNED